MKENQVKNILTTDEETEKKSEKKSSSAARDFLNGEILNKERFVSLLPYISFITFLALLIITNTYYAEKTIRTIDKTNNQLKELNAEYISIKSELMFKSKSSEVAKMVLTMGIKESAINPPTIIVVDELPE